MAARAPAAPDLGAWVRELHAAGGAARRDGDGVLWAFPALLAAGAEAAPAASGSGPASLGARALREQCARLDAERARARAWQERPFSGTASEEADATERALARGYGEESGERGERPPAPPLERRLALALGTAVHAALEEIEATAPPAEQEAAYAAAVDAALSLALAPEDRPRVREAARALWTTFAGGPLAERLARIAPHVVARELPVLLEPDAAIADEPTGFLAGAIDLLYRDPDDGAWVVADYKTDAVASGDALAGHAERYRRQGGIYVRAVQRALGLEAPPRFELWFLRAGRTVRIEPLATGEGTSASS
jgi:ATP-dependent exoDNAse (exonuclease V) beta subunit